MSKIFAVFSLLVFVADFATAQDTVHVSAGWNIIGSVKDGAVPDVLSSDPPGIITTEFYGYSPGLGYESTDTLTKGLGYWVKVSSDGIIVFNTATSISDLCGAKRVWYGGKNYHTVQIGSQCWLEENLDVGTMITGVTEQSDNATLEKYCYNNNPDICAVDGGFYQWDEAMQYSTTPGTQGICPPGWHIPTLADFQTLSSTVGDNGNSLKALGQGSGDGAGTNTSGFSALLPGNRSLTGVFSARGLVATFWCSTENEPGIAYILGLIYNVSSVDFTYGSGGYGSNVRCLED